jgi:Uma2 family endonuclease
LGSDCVLFAPADITWGKRPRDAEDLVQPDVFVVPPEQTAGEWVGVSRLVLVVEVVSPSTTRADRVVKRKTYQRHGIPTYWVVDPDAGLVEVLLDSAGIAVLVDSRASGQDCGWSFERQVGTIHGVETARAIRLVALHDSISR